MNEIDEWLNRIVGNTNNSNTFQPRVNNNKKGRFVKRKPKPKQNTHANANAKPVPMAQPLLHSKSKHRKPYGNKPQRVKPPRALPVQPTKIMKPTKILNGKIKILPLGGLNEVGKNMMVIEYENDIIVIDVGFEFPGEELPGIDYIVPDVGYLIANKKRIRGIFLTHGHLDHIGGLPYILPKLDFPPVYGTPLTLGLVEDRLNEFKQLKLAKLITINPDQPIRAGKMLCSFIRVMHSIPDCVAIVVDTPVGKIMHTGDFKFDDKPARNMTHADIGKLENLCKQNLLALLCESTNSIKPGHTISEQEVGEAIDEVVGSITGRIIISSFASQIGRIQLIIDAAVKHNRKIYVSGRSMEKNISTAFKKGYLKMPNGLILDIKKYNETKDKDVNTLILTTGSQGEPLAALARIASHEHSQIKAKKGDNIIFSSSPIIGNEHAIVRLENQFAKIGCKVVTSRMKDIHTSGHGKQDELTRMINYAKPKYLIPIHGEYFMRKALGELAVERCNMPEDKIILLENGIPAVGGNGFMEISNDIIEVSDVVIDGKGEGHIDSEVLTDRRLMAQNGALLVFITISGKNGQLKKTPDVMSRGFLYLHESQQITEDIAHVAGEAYREAHKSNPKAARKEIKKFIARKVDKFTYKTLDRVPLIIPVIIND